jgi:hypothetical protein
MKNSILVSIITISGMFAIPAYAQDSQEKMTREEHNKVEIQEQERKSEEVKAAKEHDADQITDLRLDKKETKANATEAKRLGREANEAAKESRHAYKSEKKAQKARKTADKQAKKAEKAREKSNDNK